ncbi:MAG: T9SS type A sorting domain-containing protein [Flavobacteriaceae bacterium]
MKTTMSFFKKTLFIVVFIFANTFVFAQDSDGDGVLDATETIDGTNHLDTCSYLVTSITEPINFKDCDADGLADSEEITGIDDAGTTANPNGFTSNPLNQDTDGDGVKDGDEANDTTDPNDNCSFILTSQSIAPNAAWQTLDCDNDGMDNDTEVNEGTDPQNQDTDGDGVLDGTEYSTDSTDPLNNCHFNIDNIAITPINFCSANLIQGEIRYDATNNGCDASDELLHQIKIESNSTNRSFTTFTDSNGQYQQFTDQGNYTTNIQVSNYFNANPTSSSSTFSSSGNTDTFNFCVSENTSINDLVINVIPLVSPRPGFTTKYRILYKNLGTTTLSGDVSFQYNDSKLTLQNTSETITSQTSDTLNFNYTNLSPLNWRFIDVEFLVASIPTVTIGETLNFTATVNPITGDHSPTDNALNFDAIITGSYDPNDIHVLEGYSIKLTDASEFLHYTIRFQNTGNADAINVLVTNKLDANLDWTTFQLEDTSHQGRVTIFDGNQIEFIFEDIHLPDSTTDEPNSHGYIAYKIKPKNTINVGETMSNDAKIYFDFNPAILTNVVNTTVENTANVLDNSILNVSIYPNPTTGIIQIDAKEEPITKIELYSKLGHLVFVKEDAEIHSFDISNLDNGIYFLKISSQNGIVGTKKIIKNK